MLRESVSWRAFCKFPFEEINVQLFRQPLQYRKAAFIKRGKASYTDWQFLSFYFWSSLQVFFRPTYNLSNLAYCLFILYIFNWKEMELGTWSYPTKDEKMKETKIGDFQVKDESKNRKKMG